VLPPGELRRRLSLIESQASSCTKCALGATRQRTVFSRGNPESELCFIGEGPGAEEEAAGQPFVGPAGQLLDKMIVAMGIAPEEVYIAHVVKCRLLPNKPPAPEEMAACMPYMHEQLELIKPRVIVALGATATKGLLGTHLGIKALRGTWKNYRGTIPLMPTYHPAYLLKDPSVKKEAWKDLQSVLERLGRQPPRKTS
jgi:DNA polymerase